jgi:hypothetical protein
MQISQKYAENILTVLNFIDSEYKDHLSWAKDPLASFEITRGDLPKNIHVAKVFEPTMRLMISPHVTAYMPVEIVHILDTENSDYKGRPIGVDKHIGVSAVPIAEIRVKENYEELLADYRRTYKKYVIDGIAEKMPDKRNVSVSSKFAFSLSSSGILKQPNGTKRTYNMKEGSRRLKVFLYLKKHHTKKGYIQTPEIADEVDVSASDVREAISGIKRTLAEIFKIKGQQFIEAKQGSGYRIADAIHFVD